MSNKSKKKRPPVSQTRGTKPIHGKNINEKKFEANKKKFENLQANFDIMRPFGQRIARIQCPTVITDKMIEMTDKIMEDKEHVSWGSHLVGQIKEEPLITKESLIEEGVYDFFNGVLRHYLLNVLKELYDYTEEHYKLDTAVKDMWSVHMEPGGEYNPLHYHTFCHISTVMYLKVPTRRPKRNIPNKADRDGNIEFVVHAAWPESLDRGTLVMEPTVGTLWMWPAQLLHTVYPFLGEQERRSIAWNGVFRLTEKKSGNIIIGGNP